MRPSFASRLRTAREARGLTQVDLAARTGIVQNALSHYECGRREPSLDNLRRLAVALGVSAGYLLGLEAGEPTNGVLLALGLSAREREMSRLRDAGLSDRAFNDATFLAALRAARAR